MDVRYEEMIWMNVIWLLHDPSIDFLVNEAFFSTWERYRLHQTTPFSSSSGQTQELKTDSGEISCSRNEDRFAG